MHDKKLKDFKQRQQYLLDQMSTHNKADQAFYIEGSKVLELASRAHEIFESSKPEQKWVLLKFLLQNSKLRGKKLEIDLKSPFDAVLTYAKTKDWLRIVDEVWNYFKARDLVCNQADFEFLPVVK